MSFTETVTVHALAPFNFDLTAQIFSSGDPEIRSYSNGVFHQVLKINGNLVLIEVSSVGTVENPELLVVLKSNIAITSLEQESSRENSRVYLQLGF